MEKLDAKALRKIAYEMRKDVVRMVTSAGSGHIGGGLSAADILSTLFFNVMNHEPSKPEWVDRDRFVLSKGHVASLLYSAYARSGYFQTDELKTYRQLHSRLQGHPSKSDLPFLEVSTGSLGHGLSVSVGMALASKMDVKGFRVYCIMGDGEQQEGSVWEAVMCAAHYKLDNLCAIVDLNNLQIGGKTTSVMNVNPLSAKYKAFGWNVLEIDGHNIKHLLWAFKKAAHTKGKPTVIIAKTVKGKGVKFMENQVEWHDKAPTVEESEEAIRQLEAAA